MLTAIRDNVGRLMQEGYTMEEVEAEKPTRAFDEKWGKGFLPPDQFCRIGVYGSVTGIALSAEKGKH